MFTACSEPHEARIVTISPEEMQSLISADDVQMVDVRSHEERLSDGYIKDSQHIDFSSETFEEDIENLDKNKPVALYCSTGNRSSECAEKLKAAGFVKIFDLKGGMSEWKHQGKEVIK